MATARKTKRVVTPPAIGARWEGQGGIYAGVARGQDGNPDYHLVVLEKQARGELEWQKGIGWAAKQTADGHQDFTLPAKHEAPILYANVPELFEKTGYWTNTPHAAYPVNAWVQWFATASRTVTARVTSSACALSAEFRFNHLAI